MVQKGELITLNDGKEYICVDSINIGEEHCLFLLSNFKPLEIMVVKQIISDTDNSRLETVSDIELKKEILKKFIEQNINEE